MKNSGLTGTFFPEPSSRSYKQPWGLRTELPKKWSYDHHRHNLDFLDLGSNSHHSLWQKISCAPLRSVRYAIIKMMTTRLCLALYNNRVGAVQCSPSGVRPRFYKAAGCSINLSVVTSVLPFQFLWPSARYAEYIKQSDMDFVDSI